MHEHDDHYPATHETCGISKDKRISMVIRAVRYLSTFEFATKVSRRCMEGIWRELKDGY
jgi:hypothetical protein